MDPADLCYVGAAEQARLVASGEVTARELVEATLQRIERLDPTLNAFRVVFGARALIEAQQADARRAGGDRRPLLGVPVAIKDDTDVGGEITAVGSLAHTETRAEDSEVVRALRGAGAIVIGKTHAPELAIWPFTETLAFGATRNPWSLDHTSGGSSGGAGAAMAAGLAGVAQASDGAGSIRIPSAFCGLYGIKTQRGRVSLAPREDIWNGLSVYGPIARRVEDAALFLDATTGSAEFVDATARDPGRLRVAVSTKMPPGVVARLGAEQRQALESTAELLRSLGHEVFEREVDYGVGAIQSMMVRVLRGVHDEAAAAPHPERLEPRTRSLARIGGLIPRSRVAKVRAAEPALAARINAIFDAADVVLLPGPSGPPFRIGELYGKGGLWSLNASAARVPYYGAFNLIGQPAASIPAGFDAAGLPLAVQLAGRAHDEATLLALSAQIERARPWADQRPPL